MCVLLSGMCAFAEQVCAEVFFLVLFEFDCETQDGMTMILCVQVADNFASVRRCFLL